MGLGTTAGDNLKNGIKFNRNRKGTFVLDVSVLLRFMDARF